MNDLAEKVKPMIYKTLHRKLKIKQQKPTKNRSWNQMTLKGRQLLLNMWHQSCYTFYKTVMNEERPDCDSDTVLKNIAFPDRYW